MTDGVWVVYAYDLGPYFITAWPDEVEALRKMNKAGYGHVVMVRWGERLDAAIARTEQEPVG